MIHHIAPDQVLRAIDLAADESRSGAQQHERHRESSVTTVMPV
jgi:hypothetical protein